MHSGSKPHPRWAGAANGGGHLGELAQQPPRIARVDHFLDCKCLGGPVGRAKLVQARIDLGKFRRRVLRGLDLGPVGRLGPAFQRQREPQRPDNQA